MATPDKRKQVLHVKEPETVFPTLLNNNIGLVGKRFIGVTDRWCWILLQTWSKCEKLKNLVEFPTRFIKCRELAVRGARWQCLLVILWIHDLTADSHSFHRIVSLQEKHLKVISKVIKNLEPCNNFGKWPSWHQRDCGHFSLFACKRGTIAVNAGVSKDKGVEPPCGTASPYW